MVWDTLERKGNDFIAHVYKKNDEHSMQSLSAGSFLSSINLELACLGIVQKPRLRLSRYKTVLDITVAMFIFYMESIILML